MKGVITGRVCRVAINGAGDVKSPITIRFGIREELEDDDSAVLAWLFQPTTWPVRDDFSMGSSMSFEL